MAKDEGLETGDDEPEGKIVLVAIRMDAHSRALITWALINVAGAGDIVVVLHVLLPSAEAAVAAAGTAAALAIGNELEAMVSGYHGFCNLKQIDLRLKIVKGSSVREAVVKEANLCSAPNIVLGVKNKKNGEPSASVAKYCAKRLESDCTVVALSNGKIFFEKEVVGLKSIRKISSFACTTGGDELFHQWHCLMPLKIRKKRDNVETYEKDNHSSNSYETNSLRRSQSKDEESMSIHTVETPDVTPSLSSAIVVKEPHEVCLSWPSLKKKYLKKSNSLHKMKSLPTKLPIHSCKSSTDLNVKSTRFFRNRTFLEGESKAIVPIQADIDASPFGHDNLEGNLPEKLVFLLQMYSSVCRFFKYTELQQATSNFSHEKIIGRGGSSKVYKGSLPDGQKLAVKILKQSKRRMQEFVSEIETLTALKHKNIISLIGFCLDCTNVILVYDYIPMGSLDDILHGKKDIKNYFSWPKRFKVALGIAEALNYLHGKGSSEPVIHMDVKSSNILLSNDFEPKLCDFGLARLASKVTSEITCTNVTGTFGYLAPEYFMNGDVNEKVDVYALGVVLLELISGRRPICYGLKGQENLVMWARPIIEAGEVKELIDPSLGNEYDNKEVEQLILAASLCTRKLNQARPEAHLVLKILQGDNDSIKWASSQVCQFNVPVELDNEKSISESSCNIQTHLNALFDTEDDFPSTSSTDPAADSINANTSVEEYLQWRWNRSFSFD